MHTDRNKILLIEGIFSYLEVIYKYKVRHSINNTKNDNLI